MSGKIVLTKNCLQKKHFELISFRLDGLIRVSDSETKLKDRCKLVLALLEELKSGVVFEAFTIEHILPDSYTRKTRLLGTTMLEERLNAKCKDNCAKEKLPIYAESRYANYKSFC